MRAQSDKFDLRLARTSQDLRGAERLRYGVFVEEMGGDGAGVDHAARFERDRFDPFFDHLVLVDRSVDPGSFDHVIGVYRLLSEDGMKAAGGYYSEGEYDLSALKSSGLKVLELGRSCVHRDHRSGAAIYRLWQGLADYVRDHSIDVLFGVASFHGLDPQAHALALSYLHHERLARADLRPKSRVFEPMDLMAPDGITRKDALRAMPALIKAYIRLGGRVGDGAFIDRAFNTIDVCLLMETAQLSKRHREIYMRET